MRAAMEKDLDIAWAFADGDHAQLTRVIVEAQWDGSHDRPVECAWIEMDLTLQDGQAATVRDRLVCDQESRWWFEDDDSLVPSEVGVWINRALVALDDAGFFVDAYGSDR